MTTTDKYNCRCVAAALCAYGVTDVVVSPGSRNAPLIVAFERTIGLRCHVVIDERSAAFIALGIAIQTSRPVAVCCTSGSAALNFGPALAEAYYRRIPVIAITADRPEEWIDQDDSQTIRQPDCLQSVVKGCFDLPICRGDSGLRRIVVRRMADAMLLALSGAKGPVQINVRIDEPIGSTGEYSGDEFVFPRQITTTESINAEALAKDIRQSRRVLVVAGFLPPDHRLDAALSALPSNIAVLCEAQSNLHGNYVCNIDATLQAMSAEEAEYLLRPDIVITAGGALLSRMIKARLRAAQNVRHWNVGHSDHCIDPLLHLEKRIECSPTVFFEKLSESLSGFESDSEYRRQWIGASQAGYKRSAAFMEEEKWSDFVAMGIMMESLPRNCNLHLSNGTAVRYAQLFPNHAARVECNRGVSGIDGCTSTAIGAALKSDALTLLISGDMSAQYDMGALATADMPCNFRLAVLNNGGGGIFRFIKATRDLPEMNHYLAADVRLPLRSLAEGFGFDYFEAENAESLKKMLPQFYAQRQRPAILNIITPAEDSANTIKKYFN